MFPVFVHFIFIKLPHFNLHTEVGGGERENYECCRKMENHSLSASVLVIFNFEIPPDLA